MKQKIGISPLSIDFIDQWNCDLVRASPDTIFGRFRQSIFEIASNMLLEYILSNREMKTIRLKPEIDHGLEEE